VAAGPGKPGSQGKVREFYQSGKVSEKSGKMKKKFEKSGKNKRKISTFSIFFSDVLNDFQYLFGLKMKKFPLSSLAFYLALLFYALFCFLEL